MTTNNSVDASQPGIQVLTASAIISRSIAGTTNQFAVSNADGTAGDPQLGFDQYRVLSTQPCFLAKVSGTISNVTGDATAYTILFDNEVFDQGGNYNPATGVFTAPRAGKFYFYTVITCSGLTVNNLAMPISLTGSAGTYVVRPGKLFSIVGADGYISIQGGITVSLTLNQIFNVVLTVTGSVTKNVSIYGNNDSTWLCGYEFL